MSVQESVGDRLTAESERVYVVYNADTGAIRHVHRAVTFRGAASKPPEQEAAEALDLAERMGHANCSLGVLMTEELDPHIRQRVDTAALRLVERTPR